MFGLGSTALLYVGASITVIALFLWVRAVARRGARLYEADRAARRATSAMIPQPPVQPSPASEVKINGRQVLATRCTFCSKLTPADLSKCVECGASL